MIHNSGVAVSESIINCLRRQLLGVALQFGLPAQARRMYFECARRQTTPIASVSASFRSEKQQFLVRWRLAVTLRDHCRQISADIEALKLVLHDGQPLACESCCLRADLHERAEIAIRRFERLGCASGRTAGVQTARFTA